LFLILYSSLAQNGAICAGTDIITQFARYDRNPAIGASEYAVITGGAHVTPANLFQFLDDVTDP